MNQTRGTLLKKLGWARCTPVDPSHGRAKAGRPAWTYIQQLWADTRFTPEDLPKAIDDREVWQERVRNVRADSATWWWWWWWWVNSRLNYEDISRYHIYLPKVLENVLICNWLDLFKVLATGFNHGLQMTSESIARLSVVILAFSSSLDGYLLVSRSSVPKIW